MKSICLISGSSPNFLGGISLYQRNLIDYAKKKKLNLDFTWIYPGSENKKYVLENIKCLEVKSNKFPFLREFDFSKKTRDIINKENFDVLNTHANWGYCLKRYIKKKGQKIIHTYHGVTLPYLKIQLKKFGIIKKLILSPILLSAYILEKPPIKKADRIICVSEKVKKELQQIYLSNRKMEIIRTGVDLLQFKKVPKEKTRKGLGFYKGKIYGLYSGREGYWNKGLDRAVLIGKEIYKKNKNFRLVVIGSNEKKCKEYLQEEFIIYKGVIERKEISKYYSACDFFFFLSRSEGGAPTLVVGEAMASGCFIVFSKDSTQDIITNDKEGLIVDGFGEKSAEKILKILNDGKRLKKIKENAKKKIKEFDLNSWGNKYFKVLLE